MSKKRHTKGKGDKEPAQDELQTLRQERDDLIDRLQRVSADYVNYQKRVRRDADDACAFANAELIKDLLGVLDDMERVLEAARVNHGEADPLYTGMQLVHAKAMATLGKFGLEVIDAEGKPFDPDRHSALARMPSDEVERDTVLDELVRGYTLKGRTIRPSGVVVAGSSQEDDGAADEPDEQAER